MSSQHLFSFPLPEKPGLMVRSVTVLSVVASYEMPVMEETAIDSLNIIVLMLIYLSDERPASCTLLLPPKRRDCSSCAIPAAFVRE